MLLRERIFELLKRRGPHSVTQLAVRLLELDLDTLRSAIQELVDLQVLVDRGEGTPDDPVFGLSTLCKN